MGDSFTRLSSKAFVLLALLLTLLLACLLPVGFAWHEVKESPPTPATEFRGAWVAIVHNIDWPSRSGLSSQAQIAEFSSILDRARELNLNAIIFQVRPQFDAAYQSAKEPWSQWLSGKQGGSPGYDPLQTFCKMAHDRGIELHAWFNPFRAAANPSHPTASTHIIQRHPNLVRPAGGQVWVDPGDPKAAALALEAILDVTRRYDIDGVHLDDYFYPYPYSGSTWSPNQFNDQITFQKYGAGNKLDWRRKNIDNFVQKLYAEVKSAKPWVRVGISPFGIWRPGQPSSIEAGIDAYEQLAADSRKWLSKGWLDYLAPQLYWKCEPAKQSFPTLLGWWRDQSSSRPVFPGIATARIKGPEDGRPASEIIRQINYTRSLAKGGQNGMIFWSMKSLMQNKDNIVPQMRKVFTAPAITPPLPWSGSLSPAKPEIYAADGDKGLALHWKANDSHARKWVVQGKFDGKWHTIQILPAEANKLLVNLPKRPQALSVRAVSAFGNVGTAAVVKE